MKSGLLICLKCKSLVKWNKDIKYLLMVIDVFSKYVWIKPLRDRKTESVSKAFDEIFETSKRKPKVLWTDKGSEFISKHFKEFLKSIGIKLYHTENEEKSSVVARFGSFSFSQRRTGILNPINLSVSCDFFSFTPKLNRNGVSIIKLPFFPFGYLVSILMRWYLNFESLTLYSFAPWNKSFSLVRFCS